MKITREEFKDFMVTQTEVTKMAIRAAEFLDKKFINKIIDAPVFWFADCLGIDCTVLFNVTYGKEEDLDKLYDSLLKESDEKKKRGILDFRKFLEKVEDI